MKTAPSRPSASDSHRMLWRWHFYAGLFVMPFLVVLAISGTLYCFQPQIEPILYPTRLLVEDHGEARLPYQVLMERAERAAPAGAQATTASIDIRRTRSAEFIFKLPAGGSESIYVNPYDGRVLGTLSVEDRFIQQMRMLHRKLLLGKPGELLMELVACWTLVMIATGVALWWPRQPSVRGPVLAPRRSAKGRLWWKELHAAIGIWFALAALAFVLSGLPWTGFWGKGFQILSTQMNIGSPAGAWGQAQVESKLDTRRRASADHHDTAKTAASNNSMPGMIMDDLPLRQVPWAVGLTSVPSDTAAPADTPSIKIDQVVNVAAAIGVKSGYQVVLPASATGVFTVSYFPADPKAERTIHIDRYSGAVLEDIQYSNYGIASQAVAYGTALHMGRYFGLGNQIACAVISMSLVLLAVTGFWMWWQRRPRRALGSPPRPSIPPPIRAWAIGLAILGVLFPLLGITLILVWLVDTRIVDWSISRAP